MVDNVKMIETVLDEPAAIPNHDVKVGKEIVKLKCKGWIVRAVLQNISQGFTGGGDDYWLPMIITTLVLQHPKD